MYACNHEENAFSDDENECCAPNNFTNHSKDLGSNQNAAKIEGAVSSPFPLAEKPVQIINSNSVRKRKRNKIVEKASENIETIKEKSSEKLKLSNLNNKTSLSMTSLPPEEKLESIEAGESRLKAERPYNSLKKSIDGNFGIGNKKRYSWGSGHSSSSLHSSATFGFGSGKDDLWAAIQTNYNYIMDTNLLDSCKEARGEIECTNSIIENCKDTEIFLGDTTRCVAMYSDLTDLQKWLQLMEDKLKNAPTLSEATLLSIGELERHFSEHSILYHEIVSHVRAVSACIRTASEKKKNALPNPYHSNCSQDTTNNFLIKEESSNVSTCPEEDFEIPISKDSLSNKSIDEGLENLQSRYHHLYLKAFEVQLWLDGLLRKKTMSGNNKSSDVSSDDEENWLYSSMITQAEKNMGFKNLNPQSSMFGNSSSKTQKLSFGSKQNTLTENSAKKCDEHTITSSDSLVTKNIKSSNIVAKNASCSSTSSSSSYSSNDFLTEATAISIAPTTNDKIFPIQLQKQLDSVGQNQTEGPILPKKEIIRTSLLKNANTYEDKKKGPKKHHKNHKEEIMLEGSIKKLVLGAEHLIRDDVLKTPTKRLQQMIKLSSTVKKRDTNAPGPIKKRIQEWLQLHQNTLMTGLDSKNNSITQKCTDDCEASGEASETDSKSHDSDTSEGLTDSIATCMQTSTHSQEASTDGNAGTIDTLKKTHNYCIIGHNPLKVQKRNQTSRKSERPWSVSCISQLTSESKNTSIRNVDCKFKNHSISESALNSISPNIRPFSTEAIFAEKHSDLKTLLKRRKVRRKRITNLDWLLADVADGNNPCERQQKLNQFGSDNEDHLIKPIFRVGSYTTSFMNSESRLGPLAALSNYMHNEEQHDCTTGPEDHHSSFSETAWDNYQEKYNSENYSEGVDSDAARRLLEFGDDYRNFIDSQSDCCSSLSAANNMESLSPPQIESQHQSDAKATHEQFVNTVDHNRRRRVLDLEYERRRKDFPENSKTYIQSIACSESNLLTTSEVEQKPASTNRKLEFGISRSVQSLRRTSESDTSMRRRKLDDRRRSSRNLEKNTKFMQASTSSNNSSDDEKELHNFLRQSSIRLKEVCALKERQQRLRPEDYMEITNTCRDNIRSLEAVICGPSRSSISSHCVNQTRDLVEAWKNLCKCSEDMTNMLTVQEEMRLLKLKFDQLGSEASFEILTAESLQKAINVTTTDKMELDNYREAILHCNEAINKILTQQKNIKCKVIHSPTQKKLEENDLQIDLNGVSLNDEGHKLQSISLYKSSDKQIESENPTLEMITANIFGITLEELKNEVGELYNLWNEANLRIDKQHKLLEKASTMWLQFESGLLNFQQALGQDRGTLENLEEALNEDGNVTTDLSKKIKILAHMISDTTEVNNQISSMKQHLHPYEILRIAKYTSSNGSLSDSGISDGGAISDGGFSGRERSLYALRRLAKQLEASLAPGSAATKLIESRIASAEVELKTIQNTCRDLITRTVCSDKNKKMLASLEKSTQLKYDNCSKESNINVKGKEKRDLRKNFFNNDMCTLCNWNDSIKNSSATSSETCNKSKSRTSKKDGVKPQHKYSWLWRLMKMAFPIQIVLFTIFGIVYLLQSTCCENKNTLSMSFTPQLNYRSGPPPI